MYDGMRWVVDGCYACSIHGILCSDCVRYWCKSKDKNCIKNYGATHQTIMLNYFPISLRGSQNLWKPLTSLCSAASSRMRMNLTNYLYVHIHNATIPISAIQKCQ